MMKSPMRFAPLSSGFMIVSIIGFLVSIWMVSDWSLEWAFAFSLLFVMMFISSMVSMTKAEPIDEHMEELAIHKPKIIYKKRDTSPHYNGIHTYEYFLLAYFALWLFVVFQAFANKTSQLHPIVVIAFLVSTICIILYFIVDAISNDRLTRWGQFFFTMLLAFTVGLGVFVYYIYKRMKS
jgi:MFS family permease